MNSLKPVLKGVHGARCQWYRRREAAESGWLSFTENRSVKKKLFQIGHTFKGSCPARDDAE
jgi:hypothetical protein